MATENKPATRLPRRIFLPAAVIMLLVVAAVFHQSFNPRMVLFSNDGPIGVHYAKYNVMPWIITGCWSDLNWVGTQGVSAAPGFSGFFLSILSPVLFMKFFSPLALLVLGFSAWLFCRQLQMAPTVCVLVGLAAILNMNTFSNACWGQYSRALSQASAFLAMAALVSGVTLGRSWLKTILAGFCVGLSVMEGFDVGALYSVFVAIFAVFISLIQPGTAVQKISRSGLRVTVLAVFAAFIATHSIVSLVDTQIKGVIGTDQDPASKRARWDVATQFSTAKIETLSILVPGLFGYRMDTPDGGQYWGRAGQTTGVPTSRFNGSGEYAGVLVVLLAAFALGQSFRRQKSAFDENQRKAVWFWASVALLCLLVSWGKYAPFYKLFYALPYASTIRNPMKFLHIFHLATLILFGYGLQALYRQYLLTTIATGSSLSAHLKKWWGTAAAFEKKWTLGMIVSLAASVLGYLLYTSSRKDLLGYLQTAGFADTANVKLGTMTANFSFHQTAVFLFFFILSAALVTVIVSGWFSGRRAKWAGILLGLLLVVDLARANAPWLRYWDYQYKYETNAIIDILRNKPHEHRVTMLPFNMPELAELRQLHGIEWHQQHFQFYNIQSLEFVQNPRAGSDDAQYMSVFQSSAPRLLREWELTNTRFLLGLGGGFVDQFNQQLDPSLKRFKLHTAFDIVPKPGVQVKELQDFTAVTNPQGRYGLIEFTGALPRVKLFSNWQMTNNQTILEELAKPEFNPHQTVLVSAETPVPPPANSTQPDAGTVEITAYAPKKIELNAKVNSSAVLLYNDKFNPNWKVTVDGQPAPLLRCNSIMRGVHLSPGNHQVTFSFKPPIMTLYITSAALGLAFIFCGILIFSPGRKTGLEETLTNKTATAG